MLDVRIMVPGHGAKWGLRRGWLVTLARAAAWRSKGARVARNEQDTQAVHLAGPDGKALCGAGPDALVLIEAAEWTASSGNGARVCRECAQKAESKT